MVQKSHFANLHWFLLVRFLRIKRIFCVVLFMSNITLAREVSFLTWPIIWRIWEDKNCDVVKRTLAKVNVEKVFCEMAYSSA